MVKQAGTKNVNIELPLFLWGLELQLLQSFFTAQYKMLAFTSFWIMLLYNFLLLSFLLFLLQCYLNRGNTSGDCILWFMSQHLCVWPKYIYEDDLPHDPSAALYIILRYFSFYLDRIRPLQQLRFHKNFCVLFSPHFFAPIKLALMKVCNV